MRDTSIAWALEHVDFVASSPEGEFETDLLISGAKNGSLRYVVQLQTFFCN